MDKTTRNYQISAKARTAEIMIYDDIGDSFMGGISARQFAEDVKALPPVDSINVRIWSEGGSVFAGNSIYNTLRNHPAQINVSIDALAGSIASVIAMAGDNIEISANGFVMIHDPWVITGGTADELRSQADVMDKISSKLVETYVSRTGNSEADIREWMAAETWMNAEEALERGFVDTITEDNRMAAKVRHGERYRHVPLSLVQGERPRAARHANSLSYVAAALRSKNL